jgi:ADP-L-glycero-D-manno-heptose 6-epimerase
MGWLITGAAGMIGSGVVRHLNDQGERVLFLVDDLKCGEKWKNLVGKQFVDLISRHRVMEWLQGRESEIEGILHLGACSDTTERDGDYLLENNFRFSIRLAEWALSRSKRFVYASSAATYGDGALGFRDDEAMLVQYRPLNLYGFSKHLVDLWMARQGVFDRVVGLKYFNIFGPNEDHKGKMASMIWKMARKVAREGGISLYKSNDPARFADGEQQRDFLYVKDAVRMTCRFLQPSLRHIGGLYNIGSGVATSWNRLAQALFAAMGRSPEIRYIDLPEELSLQYQNYTCADMRKFHRLFPEETCLSIEAAVSEYWQSYLLHDLRW